MTRREILAEGCEVFLGDMLEILPTLGEFDACVTDPPYGIGADKGKSGTLSFKGGRAVAQRAYCDDDWDDRRPEDACFSVMRNCSKYQIIWGGNYFADLFPPSGKWLWWDKCQTMPSYGDGELAWTNLAGTTPKKFVLSNNKILAQRRERFHPTQKPDDLMEWCIDQLPSDVGTILDPFMGSGTTGVAAVKKGKAFYGIEREPKYFDIACRRISDALKRPDLFIPAPAPKAKQESLL